MAIGLSGGFLEPLESTSIHLIQSGIAKLLSLFPDRACDPLTREQYNRVVQREFEDVRDFLILHYHSTSDRPEPMWEHCRRMKIPEALAWKVAQFSRSGRIVLGSDELFKEASWFAVLMGQGHRPGDYNPLIDAVSREDNLAHLRAARDGVRAAAAKMADHASFFA